MYLLYAQTRQIGRGYMNFNRLYLQWTLSIYYGSRLFYMHAMAGSELDWELSHYIWFLKGIYIIRNENE